MGRINAEWHRAHRMPRNPTLDQRIEWHLAHTKACGCREITGKLRKEFERRGIKVPSLSDTGKKPGRRSAQA
jgi:hypothetical protein